MAAVGQVHPTDIVCGVNFSGQNVDCSTNPPLQQFLVPFINRFLNTFLQESLAKPSVTDIMKKVVKLKKGIFFLSSSSQYYDLFFQYMTQATPVTIDVGGVLTPLFNVDYLPDVSAPIGNITQDNVDIRVVKLYVSSLSYHMLSMMGWIRDPIGDFYGNVVSPGSTIQGVYRKILPVNVRVPQNVQQACIQQIGNTIQKIYFTRGVLFFSLGGGFDQRPGYVTNYIVNTTTQNPPIPSGHIVWNNVDPLASTQILMSTFDKNRMDVEYILQSTNVIRIRSVTHGGDFQNWQVTQPAQVVSDQYVQFTVTLTDGAWRPQNNQECRIFLMSSDQTLPTYQDELTQEIKGFITQIGGTKKIKNKSRRNKSRRNKSRRNKSRRNKSRRNKSRRNKSRRNKSRRNKGKF
jgi:hypothetical protein